MTTLTDPASHALAVTKSDSTILTLNGAAPRGLYVGGAGDVAVQFGSLGAAVVFASVAAGTLLPIRPHRVMSTNTTATNIVAVY